MDFDPKAYLAKKQTAPAPGGGFDPKAYLASKTPAPEPEDNRGLISKGVDYGLRGLDYAGGLARTGIAQAIDAVHPEDVVTKDDWTGALQGKAPTSAKYLEKMGVEEGPSADLPLLGKTSARDVEGFALDMATDPLGPLVRSAGLLAKGIKGAGTKMYKSGFKKIDERLAEKGIKPVSDVLLEHGAPTGTTAKIAKAAKGVSKDAQKSRSGLYREAHDLGARVDMSAATAHAEKTIAELKRNPGTRELADQLTDFVNKYKAEGFTDLQTASDWKTAFYDSLPASAYSGAKLKSPAKAVQKELARGFKEAIENSADFVRPGLGKEISSANEVMGSIKEAANPLKTQIRRANTPNYVTSTDPIVGGLGALAGGSGAGLGLLGAKKGTDLAKTTWARTKAGKGLINLSKIPGLDPIVERGLINANKDE